MNEQEQLLYNEAVLRGDLVYRYNGEWKVVPRQAIDDFGAMVAAYCFVHPLISRRSD